MTALPVDEMGEPPLTVAQQRAFDLLADTEEGAITVHQRTSTTLQTVGRVPFLNLMRYELAEYIEPGNIHDWRARLTENGKARAERERARAR